ncbi:stage II sporulation protein P [Paenibacillus sp. IB182496]|uniref:Stage II sporulation protein P n=1 Tax=Paenibacillus sabuli TaxID=2772509 RepID=A0A927BQN3_9BACL|nr:stage II sporulation protein P [Paenibacillus sabuli]MBD2844477.1 stage II sporulation protein P [Paenibacillus sabuli]
MKKTLQFGEGRRAGVERLKALLTTGRTFAWLSVASSIFFIVLGLGGMLQKQVESSPLSSMKGMAAGISGGWFGQMLGMEIPAFEGKQPPDGSLLGTQTAAFVMRLLTDINPEDPRSLIAGELPGLGRDESFLIRGGSGPEVGPPPRDTPPVAQAPQETGAPSGQRPDSASEPTGPDQPPSEGGGTGSEQAPPPDGESGLPERSTGSRKPVFIYHTHNRESWYPELGEGIKDPSSADTNITMVGKRLAESLERLGVGAQHSATDYPTEVASYRWELLYTYSRSTVKQAMLANSEVRFIFDLHRDSLRRKDTTVTIDGEDYAQVFFIIGHRNPDWRENEAFATQIHEMLEARYPGLSRGIWGKDASTGNGEYNQSLAPESVLVEIGGVDNTLAESNRTADALAEVIAELYWQADKVDGAAE